MLSRRELIAATSALALAPAAALAKHPINPKRKRTQRIAHLTDIHVQPENGAPEGFEAALKHAQSQKPDWILTGGDLIMDALGASKDRTRAQWDIFHRVLKANTKLPVEHTIGNHDVWGWNIPDQTKNDPLYGKKWASDELGLERPYRSFDRKGWHIIILDSTHRKEGPGYTARLDDEQFEWLKDDLAKTPAKTPVMISSHIPIIAVCSMFDGDNEKTGNWVIPGAWVHIDARRIKDLFRKHPNVKLCVSGHEHLLDQVLYNDVTYCCNGAVSAAWWGGDYQEVTYGYTLVDLYDDGSFENRYIPYGWKTRA